MAVKRVWGSLQICCCSARLCICQKSLFKCTWCLKSEIRSGCTIAPHSAETWSAWKEEISQCTQSGADNIPSENEADEIHFLIKVDEKKKFQICLRALYRNSSLHWRLLLLLIMKVWNLKWSLTFCPILHSCYFFHSTFFNLWNQRSYWVGTTFYVTAFHAAIDFTKEKKTRVARVLILLQELDSYNLQQPFRNGIWTKI